MSKDLRFGNLNGLFQFNNYVRELIAENCVADVELQLCDGETSQDSFSDGWSGYYFSLTAKNGTKIFPWFGVKYYIEDETWLALDFEFLEDCDDPIKLKKDEICEAFEKTGFGIEQDDDGISVYLQKDEFEKFQQIENDDEQKTFVKDFFIKTLDIVKEFI